MVKKSVTAFTLGMISSFVCIVWGVIAGIFGDILAISGVAPNITKLIAVFGYICLFGGFVGIAGAGLSLKNSWWGALGLGISTLMCAPLFVFLMIQSVKGNLAFASIIVFLLLTITLMIVALFFALVSKPIQQPHYANDAPDNYAGPDAENNRYHYNRNNSNENKNE